MKKLALYFAAITLLLVACQNDSMEILKNETQATIDMSDFYVYTYSDFSAKENDKSNSEQCLSMKELNRQLDENPGLENRLYNIEKHTRTYISFKKENGGGGKGKGGNNGSTTAAYDDGFGTINLPIYLYVVYSNETQNISNEQIQSQIAVLNQDFNDTGYEDVPEEFRSVAANINITFSLEVIDRQFNSTFKWGFNSSLKESYPAVPGYLTIWVANIGNGVYGYAQFPGGEPSTDGIVISPQYFGTTGTVSSPHDSGRTATHEVGHWLNLRHIWGDGNCRQDDFCDDTPSSDSPNYGCPTYPTSGCRKTSMTMNYMDYSNGNCTNMFTLDQKNRMRATFADGGPRANFR